MCWPKSSFYKLFSLIMVIFGYSTLNGQSDEITLDYIIDNTPLPVVQFGYPQHYSATKQRPHSVIAVLEDFDFDAKCTVEKFKVKRVRKGEADMSCLVSGHRFDDCVEGLIEQSKSGDEFVFFEIFVLCPGYDNPIMAEGTLRELIR